MQTRTPTQVLVRLAKIERERRRTHREMTRAAEVVRGVRA